jgi:hypothetical protein
VEFRLVYEGPLVAATKNKARAPERQELRRHFHKQLRRLWHTNPQLLRLAQQVGMATAIQAGKQVLSSDDGFLNHVKSGLNHLGRQSNRFGCDFVPLVTQERCLQCSLEILFLRPDDSGTLIQAGDLDHRLKTLFEALRLPNNREELAGYTPTPEDTPLFCLLQEEKLITEFKVTTDVLPLLSHEKESRAQDVFLGINVRLSPTAPHLHAPVF